jgi:peptidyl-dipeptidase Dcp
MKKLLILSAMMMTLVACKCGNDNPLLSEQNTPYGVPAFDIIKLEHFRPAFDVAIEAATKEVNAIATSKEAPTFQNTIAALDRSGKQLRPQPPFLRTA